jgi:predicted nucleic acid-binding protein
VILVDTSVWVDHLRRGNDALAALLRQERVLCHPFVAGELACGRLRRRAEVLDLLARLPPAPIASHGEALTFVEGRRLMGCGLGWVDVHLLASASLARRPLWTLDRSLAGAAGSINLAWRP